MRFIFSTGLGLLGAFLGVLVIKLLSERSGGGAQLWVWTCFGVGGALGAGIDAQWQLSRTKGALLICFLSTAGYVIGTLLSN